NGPATRRPPRIRRAESPASRTGGVAAGRDGDPRECGAGASETGAGRCLTDRRRTGGRTRDGPDGLLTDLSAGQEPLVLDVVVEGELVRVGPQPDGIDLTRPLVGDVGLDEVVGE